LPACAQFDETGGLSPKWFCGKFILFERKEGFLSFSVFCDSAVYSPMMEVTGREKALEKGKTNREVGARSGETTDPHVVETESTAHQIFKNRHRLRQ